MVLLLSDGAPISSNFLASHFDGSDEAADLLIGNQSAPGRSPGSA
jgi:hypothetical protein